jgi:uncharacterized membrane protein
VRLVRTALKLLVVVVVAVAGTLAYLAFTPIGDADTHPFNQDRNAVWLEHRWLEREHSSQEMDDLLSGLEARGVGYVYPHLIPFDASGNLPPHSREQMRSFLAAARRSAPRLKVLPWVGGLRVGYRRQRTGTVNLGDLRQRQRIVAECRGLMDEGFDGIHVNVEPIPNGDADFLALLRALRTAVGEGRILSLSATRPTPLPLPIAPNFAWTHDYYGLVASVTDQLVVMSYDTAAPTSALYRRYVAYVASSLTASLARSPARVLVGVPTYDETGLMHRGSVETPENALLGVVWGLRGRGEGGTFEGVALYAEWTTDDREWDTYERIWRNHR